MIHYLDRELDAEKLRLEWAMRASLVYEVTEGQFIIPMTDFTWVVDEHGQANFKPFVTFPPSLGLIVNSLQGPQPTDNHMAPLYAPFLALSFWHCRNVMVKETDPSGMNRAYRKRVEHQQGVPRTKVPPLVRYRTLEIEPMRRAIHQARQGGERRLANTVKVHIRSGHFKT